MSIRSLADARGQSVGIHVASKAYDSVNTIAYTYPGTATRTVKAYVADNGAAWEQERGRPSSPRSVTVYIPGNDAIDGQDIFKINSITYNVTNVKHPGMKTRGAMAYTIVDGVTDAGK